MTQEDKTPVVQELEAMGEHIGTLSTVDESGQPQSAVLYFLFNNNLDLYFIVRSGSRKYANLSKNPRAAFVVSTTRPAKTIQFEGTVSEVLDPQEQLLYYNKLAPFVFQNNASTPVNQMLSGELVLLKMTATWIRLGNFHELSGADKFLEVR